MRNILVSVLLFTLAWQAGIAKADVTPAQVENSIRRGIAYLEKRQLANGGWPEFNAHNCGLSSLCTLALVTAGVSPDAPSIQRAMAYLRTKDAVDTYSVSLQTLALCQVGAREDLPLIQRNVRWLENQQAKPGQVGRNSGAWGYGHVVTSGDPSNTQFALLALSAAEERGVAVSPAIFERSLEYWMQMQERNGGWPYTKNLAATGSMTSAAIASIIICRGHLTTGTSRINGNVIECCGSRDERDVIEEGLEWLGNSFTVRGNPGAGGAAPYHYYFLYALERVGRFTGRRKIGEADWYRQGAEVLVSLQNDLDGFWQGLSNEDNRNVATSFALLFLAKGKRQVAVGRLDHADEPGADAHPDGLKQLVRHLERDWGRDLTWQIFSLQGASVADLLQTPVLVISGNQPLSFSAPEKELLQEYVRNGGFILFEANAGGACGPAEPFERSVAALCQELFAAPLERLPPTHPIWYTERPADPTAISKDFWVYGVQTCCRTGVAYVPIALSCRWELNSPTKRIEYAPAVQEQLDAATTLGENIIAYATGRELKEKLEMRSVLVSEDNARDGDRGVIVIPRLAIDAGGDDAKRAIPNLARYLERALSMQVATETPAVAVAADQLAQYPIAWLHGREGFELTDDQIVELRQYLSRGGVLLVDSICGDEQFSQAVRTQLAKVLPQSPLTPAPPDHPLLTRRSSFDLSNVTLRLPERGSSGAITVRSRQMTAVLETAELDGRIAIVFSPYDLSCALESQNSVQCPGYTTEDAAKIAINMVVYSLTN